MKISIRWRLVFMYVMLVVIAMITAGTIIVLMLRGNEERELIISVKESINLIRTTAVSSGVDSDIDKVIEDLFENNSLEFSNKKILILDNNANVVFPEKYKEQGLRITTHQIIGAIEDGYFEEPDIGYIFDDDDKPYIGIAENIKKDGVVKYIIYGLVDYSNVKLKVISTVKIISIAILITLLIAIVIAFIFSNFITKPILAITDSARYLADGTLKGNIEVHSNDEIGQLTNTFNKMAKSLNNTLNEITTEKNKLETVFEHMTDGILVFDTDGRLLHFNKATSSMLKATKNASFKEVIGEALNEEYDELKVLLEKGTVVRALEDNSRFFELYFAKYKEQIGHELGVMCVIQDVTENKRVENLQKEFVANVSHELRTPITTIKTYSETLIDSFNHEEKAELDFLKTINRESDRMTNIVTDLLSLAKLDNKKDSVDFAEVDLVALVESVYDNFSLIVKNTEKTMELIKPDFVYMVNIDVAKIEQVVKNIISNAVKYTDDDGNIKISFRSDISNYYVEISDDGFGIPKDDLPRIFERFYRVDKTRSREMGGTGLGLSIAKELMNIHGGDIIVTSSEKRGSTFTLIFPKEVVELKDERF